MSEYDIPIGPLSTAVFLTVSDSGDKVWFTEYTANKIAYLDTTIPIPFEMQISVNQTQNEDIDQSIGDQNNNSVNTPLVLKPSDERLLDIMLKNEQFNSDNNNDNTLNNNIILPTLSSPPSSLSLDEVELSVIGMTDTGLVPGLTYSADPQRINMSKGNDNNTLMQTGDTYSSIIKLVLDENVVKKIRQNEYTVMIKPSAAQGVEWQQQQQRVQPPLFVSLLYPIPIVLDLPVPTTSDQQQTSNMENNNSKNQSGTESFFGIKDISTISIIRTLSLTGVIGLVGYRIYTRVKR
jgi:hypothetical protein